MPGPTIPSIEFDTLPDFFEEFGFVGAVKAGVEGTIGIAVDVAGTEIAVYI
jgi:hypothetical protein